MRLRPVIALVDDETMAKLRPIIDELSDAWATMTPTTTATMAANGWTPEMIAWGLVLGATARGEWTYDHTRMPT